MADWLNMLVGLAELKLQSRKNRHRSDCSIQSQHRCGCFTSPNLCDRPATRRLARVGHNIIFGSSRCRFRFSWHDRVGAIKEKGKAKEDFDAFGGGGPEQSPRYGWGSAHGCA